MRQITAHLALGTLLLLSGCHAPWMKPVGPTPTQPTISKDPTAAELVAILNANSQKIQGFNSQVDITAVQGNQSIGLDGDVACQKPRSFRLKANIVGKSGVDLGSNDEEFWYWISKNDPPYLFHCSYRDLPSVKSLPFPFQPEMVVKAMGLADYDVSKCTVSSSGSTVNLQELTESPQKEQIYKVTVFNRNPVAPPKPMVMSHLLMDTRSRVICRADVVSVQVDQPTGAVLPSMIRFSWPDQKLEMTMRFYNTKSTYYEGNQYEKVFTRRDLKMQSYDLARGKLDNQSGLSTALGANTTSLQRTGAWGGQ